MLATAAELYVARVTGNADTGKREGTPAMAFVQIIQFKTSRIDEMQKVGDEWEAAIGDDRKAARRILCKDRDNADSYLNIVFFDSYESAMENSEHPVTKEFSEKMMKLGDGPPTFYNLDILDERP